MWIGIFITRTVHSQTPANWRPNSFTKCVRQASQCSTSSTATSEASKWNTFSLTLICSMSTPKIVRNLSQIWTTLSTSCGTSMYQFTLTPPTTSNSMNRSTKWCNCTICSLYSSTRKSTDPRQSNWRSETLGGAETRCFLLTRIVTRWLKKGMGTITQQMKWTLLKRKTVVLTLTPVYIQSQMQATTSTLKTR